MAQHLSQTVNRPIKEGAPIRRNILLLALFSVAGMACFAVLAAMPDTMIGPAMVEALLVFIILTGVLIAILTARTRGRIDARQQLLLMASVLFSFLIVAERVFHRYSTLGAAYRGDFEQSAYDEAAIWAFCFAVLMLITLRSPDYLRRLLKPSFRWMFLLALVSMASAAYSPAKAYSFAWGFKMVLAVMLLRVILDEIESMEELRWFLQAVLWSFTALVVLCLLQFITAPHPWEGGRMSETVSPTGVAAIAGTLFLLGLTFYAEESRKKYLFLSGLGFCAMLLSGGKGAIIAAILAGTAFFVLRNNLKSGLMFLAATVLLGGILLAVTPLQNYVLDYARSGEAETGTGRIGLWQVVIPAIIEKPWLGHGFMASKFLVEDEPGVEWPAGHTHNGFLEVLYNNGVLGLGLLLAVMWRTVRSLLWVTQGTRAGRMRLWAIGAFTIFIFEILNGMLNASFGGRPNSSYLAILSLFIVSEVLAGLLQRARLQALTAQSEVVSAQ